MSYILDALKQSDRQRQRGKVPDLQSGQPGLEISAPTSRRWPTWLLGGAALITALLLYVFQGGLLHGDSPSQLPSADALPGDEVTAQLAVSIPVDPPEKGRAEMGLLALPEEVTADLRIQLEDHVTKVPSSLPADVPGSGSVPATAVVMQQPGQGKKEVAGATSNPKEQDLARTEGGSEERLSKQVLAKINPFDPSRIKSNPGTAPSTKNVQKANLKSAGESVLYWRQLPLNVQRSLPSLDFTVHIYSENPAARMVKINGAAMREGQSVSRFLRLEQITPNGVILVYKTYRFSMNVI